MQDSTQCKLTAIILAGGRGRRMGMQNKGLLLFKQQPLVEHVIMRLRSQVSRIVISANDDLHAYRQFGLPVIPDRTADYAGPLAGIYSAMYHDSSEWFITAPCDAPCLPADYVLRMLTACGNRPACVAHDGQRQQSGCCLLHRSLLAPLEHTLQAGHFAVHRFLTDVAAGTVDFSDETRAFVNINSPADLAVLDHDPCLESAIHE